jgi:hypothetical protein
MIEARGCPLVRCVARLAVVVAGDVTGLFARRDQAVVAAYTRLWRSLEEALDVATAALNILVTFA